MHLSYIYVCPVLLVAIVMLIKIYQNFHNKKLYKIKNPIKFFYMTLLMCKTIDVHGNYLFQTEVTLHRIVLLISFSV